MKIRQGKPRRRSLTRESEARAVKSYLRNEVMPMTVYESVDIVLTILQIIISVLAMKKK